MIMTKVSASDKQKLTKCSWITQQGKSCSFKNLHNKFYCKRHGKYEGVFLPSQITSLKKCSGCKNLFSPENNFKTCSKCLNREKKKIVYPTKCQGKNQKGEPCNHKTLPDNNYCGKHQSYKKWKDLTNSGFQVCKNWIRGCFECLDNESISKKYSNCVKCRNITKIKDTERYKNKGIEAEKFNLQSNVDCRGQIINMCRVCSRKDSECNFKGLRCLSCYDLYRKTQDNRNPREKENIKLLEYKSSSKKRRKAWELTDTQAKELFRSPCHYCKQEIQINGIDRIDSMRGYTIDNVVSCCSCCNYMKTDMDYHIFFKRCEHIATINQRFSGLINFDIFNKNKDCKYSKYKFEAKHRSLSFEISQSLFIQLVSDKCFYCHSYNCSGIDRINSTIGYIQENVRGCCGTCNIMKNTQTSEQFLIRCETITKIKNKVYEKLPETHRDKILKCLSEQKIHINSFYHEKFRYLPEYYQNLVCNPTSYDELISLLPELELVENKKQQDIWNYYRRHVSSLKVRRSSNLVGRQIFMLVKDKISQKYMGIMSLSSDIYSLEHRDLFIGWYHSSKNKNLKYIMNLSTCVSIQPFGFNFNGGKLLTSLIFSKEVLQRFRNKYGHHLLGITTTSLYGKSIQYDRLKCLKHVGFTKGNSTYQISSEITKLSQDYLKTKGYDYPLRKKFIILQKTFDLLNLPKEEILSNPKGIYFGFTSPQSQHFLQGKTDTIPDPIPDAKTTQEIFDWWVDRWAKQRYTHLQKTGKFQGC